MMNDTMPQTVEGYRELAIRDLELIMEQREEINRLKCRLNDLQQKSLRSRYVPVREQNKRLKV